MPSNMQLVRLLNIEKEKFNISKNKIIKSRIEKLKTIKLLNKKLKIRNSINKNIHLK